MSDPFNKKYRPKKGSPFSSVITEWKENGLAEASCKHDWTLLTIKPYGWVMFYQQHGTDIFSVFKPEDLEEIKEKKPLQPETGGVTWKIDTNLWFQREEDALDVYNKIQNAIDTSRQTSIYLLRQYQTKAI